MTAEASTLNDVPTESTGCPVNHQEKTTTTNEASSPSTSAPLSTLSLSPLVPGGLPLLGNALGLVADPIEYMRKKYFEMGPIFRVKAAHRNIVVLGGPEANAYLGSAEAAETIYSEPFWNGVSEELGCPHFLVKMDGPDHKLQRKTFQPKLSKEVAKPLVEQYSQFAKDVFSGLAIDEKISPLDYYRELLSRQVSYTIAGQLEPLDPKLTDALFFCTKTLLNVTALGKWPSIAFKLPRYQKGMELIKEFVAKSLTEQKGTGGWVDAALEIREKRPDLMTDGDLFLAGLTPYIAGLDTVASTFTFISYELLRNPDILMRLRAEVDNAFEANDGNLPDANGLKALECLNGTIMESLRLHPPGFGMQRYAKKEFEYMGYRIPKGQEIMFFTTSPHTDPQYFKNPYKFDIDRFGRERGEHRVLNIYAPFGRGPHTCLGSGMADVILKATVATVVRHFDFELVNPNKRYKNRYDPSLTLGPEYKVRFKGWRKL